VSRQQLNDQDGSGNAKPIPDRLGHRRASTRFFGSTACSMRGTTFQANHCPLKRDGSSRLANGADWKGDLQVSDASDPMFWRDQALPFIEARSVRDGRQVCYAKHWHENFSIGLITQGRCNYINRRKAIAVSVGTVVLMNPGDVHACNPVQGEPWSYKMLYIDVPWLCETQGAASINRNHGFAPFSMIATTQPELYDGLSCLFDTLTNPKIAHLEKQTASVSFVELVQRRLGTGRSTHPARPPRLARAADFIRQNCSRSLSLDDICVEASLSASHLIRAFKEVYGLTPHAYQLNCRIEIGRSQLRAGRSIADVAFTAGFSDQAHFQRVFKRFVAATPGQYRAHIP
jgi:AraC-like DNA-binding protein